MWHLTWKTGSKLHDVTREESSLLCGQKKITKGLEKNKMSEVLGNPILVGSLILLVMRAQGATEMKLKTQTGAWCLHKEV